MADDTQGKAQQRPAGGPSNAAAIDKGEAVAASRPARTATARTATAPEPENSVLNPGGKDDDRPTREEIEKRDPKTYRASERGYVDGKVVEPGEVFVTKVDKGMWMEPVKKGDLAYGVDAAVDEAQYGKKADVDYAGMDKHALQALAALLGVTKPGELDKDELISAIKAARIPVAQ